MPDAVSEAIALVIDTSRSMFRRDYQPNRLGACKNALLKFVESRFENDESVGGSTAFALIVFDSRARTIIDFPDGARYEQIKEALEKEVSCGGKSALGDGIGKAIKLLIEDIRSAGARIPRLLIFSDGKFTKSKVDPLKMANLAKQLQMHIDTFRIGEVEHFNVMKRLSDITNGKYTYSNNSQNFLESAEEMGYSNIEAHGAAYVKKGFTAIHKKIAAPLLSESQMSKGTNDQQDLIAQLRGTKSYKQCSVCFMSDDPMSKTSFNISGRYCPNCGKPMHVSCASMWAKSNDKEGDGTVFRCPQCFYLTKIPASVQTAVKMHQEVKKEEKTQSSAANVPSYQVSAVMANSLGDAAMYSACPVCNGIFEEDEQVISCPNEMCNAIYHMNCFSKLKDGRCKSCGSILRM